MKVNASSCPVRHSKARLPQTESPLPRVHRPGPIRRRFSTKSIPPGSLKRRKLTGHRLASVPAVGGEIRAVHRPDFTAAGQLGHAHQAGVRQIHFLAGIFVAEIKQPGQFGPEIKGRIQPQIPSRQQPRHAAGRAQQPGRLQYNGLAGMKRRRPAQAVGGPGMVRIAGVGRRGQQAGVSDSFQGGWTADGGRYHAPGGWCRDRGPETPSR